MNAQSPLFLHEELLLLALRDEEGTVSASMYLYGLSGAILAELLFHERIRVEDSKKKLVHPVDSAPLGEPLLDECLDKIAKAESAESLTEWLERFTAIKHLRDRVAERLCQRGILRVEKGTFLFVFPKTTYPEVDHGPEGEVMNRLREAIFTDAEDVSPRTAVLISLASSAEILPTIFDRKELSSRHERIEKITRTDLVGQAAREAVEAMQIALAMASFNTTLIN